MAEKREVDVTAVNQTVQTWGQCSPLLRHKHQIYTNFGNKSHIVPYRRTTHPTFGSLASGHLNKATHKLYTYIPNHVCIQTSLHLHNLCVQEITTVYTQTVVSKHTPKHMSAETFFFHVLYLSSLQNEENMQWYNP